MTGWYDRKGLHRIPVGTEPEKTAAPAWRNRRVRRVTVAPSL